MQVRVMMRSSRDRYLTTSVRIIPTSPQSDEVLGADTDERAELSSDLDAAARRERGTWCQCTRATCK